MNNIFDFAYKELTNTAIWAWILSMRHIQDNEIQTIEKKLTILLGIPPDAILNDNISTNINLTSKDQLDILARYSYQNEEIFLVIENKTRKDLNVISQLKRYIDVLKSQGAKNLIPCIFTFDLEMESERTNLLNEGIRLFTIQDMQMIFGISTYKNEILNHYSQYLKKKNCILKL